MSPKIADNILGKEIDKNFPTLCHLKNMRIKAILNLLT